VTGGWYLFTGNVTPFDACAADAARREVENATAVRLPRSAFRRVPYRAAARTAFLFEVFAADLGAEVPNLALACDGAAHEGVAHFAVAAVLSASPACLGFRIVTHNRAMVMAWVGWSVDSVCVPGKCPTWC
jgi:hypothetical protein